jgi:hypothetical protein
LRAGGPANSLTAQEVTDEAVGQALRASEIVRSLRQLVSMSETEKRTEALASLIEEAGALVLSGSLRRRSVWRLNSMTAPGLYW